MTPDRPRHPDRRRSGSATTRPSRRRMGPVRSSTASRSSATSSRPTAWATRWRSSADRSSRSIQSSCRSPSFGGGSAAEVEVANVFGRWHRRTWLGASPDEREDSGRRERDEREEVFDQPHGRSPSSGWMAASVRRIIDRQTPDPGRRAPGSHCGASSMWTQDGAAPASGGRPRGASTRITAVASGPRRCTAASPVAGGPVRAAWHRRAARSLQRSVAVWTGVRRSGWLASVLVVAPATRGATQAGVLTCHSRCRRTVELVS